MSGWVRKSSIQWKGHRTIFPFSVAKIVENEVLMLFYFLVLLFQPRQHPFILPPMHVQCGEHYTETHNSQGT